VRKYAVVRVPRSVYAAAPGMGKHRPSQETPVRNFVLAGDWTAQKFLGSMEGAVLAGKLAAEVVSARAAGERTAGVRVPAPAREQPTHAAALDEAAEPRGVDAPPSSASPLLAGRSPVAFGGGQAGGMIHH
jgi:15-cis-phytoene desaturase